MPPPPTGRPCGGQVTKKDSLPALPLRVPEAGVIRIKHDFHSSGVNVEVHARFSRAKKNYFFAFFLIFTLASFSMAAVSTPMVTSIFRCCIALSTNPLPVGVRTIRVVDPGGLPIAPAEISENIAVRSVQK